MSGDEEKGVPGWPGAARSSFTPEQMAHSTRRPQSRLQPTIEGAAKLIYSLCGTTQRHLVILGGKPFIESLSKKR